MKRCAEPALIWLNEPESVTIVDDEAEVLRLHRERIKRIALREESDDDLKARLIREERVVLVLTPDRFYPASMA